MVWCLFYEGRKKKGSKERLFQQNCSIECIAFICSAIYHALSEYTVNGTRPDPLIPFSNTTWRGKTRVSPIGCSGSANDAQVTMTGFYIPSARPARNFALL